ncbi:hypothetical protein E3N88_39875 [Mikania micrantha]|uniref:Uncharacterized protein n=1 Tax=Mikania micrantha TaxID=192012 RepID=A0A5N6LNA2_9ASTR|nr:hypothetical protein E3N88_39875 [Mikania micrantha]
MDEFALMANHNHRIRNLLLTETETGNSNKAPKLLSLDDYPHWKYRFEIHINGVDTNLWMIIKGNDALKNIKSKALRKEFNNFMYVGNESLDELIARFYHLLSELYNYQVMTTTQDIHDFIQKIKEHEIENK